MPDASGSKLLIHAIRTGHPQARADSLTALAHIIQSKDVALLTPLSLDRHFYVKERFVDEMNKRPTLRKAAIARLERDRKTASKDDAGHIAIALTLMGLRRHGAEAGALLTTHPGPRTDDELHQLGGAAHALARAGHKEGLDAALHLFKSFRGKRPTTFGRYVLSVFFEASDASIDWQELSPAEAHTKLEPWWKRERSSKRFNAVKNRFE